MIKRNLLALIASAILLVAVMAFSIIPAFASQFRGYVPWAAAKGNNHDRDNAVIHIAGLTRISEVGSTAFVIDANGKTVPVDPNPYGIAIVPANTPASNLSNGLKTGDVVVTDIGNNHDGGVIVRFPNAKGPAHIFNTPDANTKGPAMQAINTTTGTDWVANLAGNNVQVFRPNGTVEFTLTNPLFNHPWGMAFNQGRKNPIDGSIASFFASNALDATIDRIDLVVVNGKLTFKVFQVGQLTKMVEKTKIGLIWTPSLTIQGHQHNDVLLALDPANNRIAAFPNSTTLNTTANKSTDKGMTVFQGKPLNTPGGFALNPLDTNAVLVVNLNDNNLVEVDMAHSKAIGVRQLDNVPVDPANGNGSALFGIGAVKDQQGNLKVFFTDDNTNTLDVLSAN
ncbi:MAG TPA: hypothetical protein VFB60_12610 [Ktedonobacteraceae bacterium]|nr:hypothetical protein [Ktedonobacteraceae bacterium]